MLRINRIIFLLQNGE